MSNLKLEELLFNDQPITINRKLAKYLGLTEAIIFQQIHYWLKINEKTKNNLRDDRFWVYNSVSAWQKNEFEFLSESTIKRTLQKLEKLGLLDVGVFNKMKGDKTKWYTINYDRLLEVCEKVEAEKNELSEKRKAAGKLAAKARKNKSDDKNTMGSNWSDGEASVQLDPTIGSNWSDDKTKLVQPIPKTTTKTTTKISTSSSSKTPKGEINLFLEFNNNICELKKTTTIKLENIIKNYDKDMILAIIEECSTTGVKSYSGFQAAFNSYIDRNCKTRADVIAAATKYRENKKKTSTKQNYESKYEPKKLKFNNFEAREYDYNSLEKKLLGWDTETEY